MLRLLDGYEGTEQDGNGQHQTQQVASPAETPHQPVASASTLSGPHPAQVYEAAKAARQAADRAYQQAVDETRFVVEAEKLAWNTLKEAMQAEDDAWHSYQSCWLAMPGVK